MALDRSHYETAAFVTVHSHPPLETLDRQSNGGE